MPITRVFNLGGINTYVNPILKKDGDLLRSVNVESYPYGAKRKRVGYNTFLGTADGSAVTDLFSWTKNDGTTLFLYRKSGTKLYYSVQGTGAWTVCGNGTVSGEHVGHAVLDDTLIIGDGVGSTRHTTNGTAFTNTVLAPVAPHFAQYQNRIYAAGTSSTTFYSTTGSAANWALSGTGDSSSFTVPGAGKMGKIFTCDDRLVLTKNSGIIHRWDGNNLTDISTRNGPSSPYSVADHEGYYLYLNDEGIYGYGGVRPEVLSNPIQAQMYNASGSGVAGAALGTAAGEAHFKDYYLAVGTVTDDIVNETVDDCVIKYDFSKNEFSNYSYSHFPYCFHSYSDANDKRQLIFGSSGGQVYQIDGTANSDAGEPIDSLIEFFLHLGAPEMDKEWKKLWALFNPGNQVKMQVAISNTLSRANLRWIDLGDFSDGMAMLRFPDNSRGRFLFVRIYDSSVTSKFKFYGMSVDVDIVSEDK